MSISIRLKKTCVLVTMLGVFAGLMLGTGLCIAKSKKSKANGEKVMVDSVNASSQEVTILIQKDQSKTTYSVDNATKITVEDNPGSFKVIHSGQEVYDYVERTSSILDSIDVGPVKTDTDGK